jgi:hypothetical protein
MGQNGASTQTTLDVKTLTQPISEEYLKTIIMSGAAYAGNVNYYKCYNMLHRLDYFEPHVTGNLHLFLTRPFCNFSPNNIDMNDFIKTICYSAEGCCILASLMAPFGKNSAGNMLVDTESDETYIDSNGKRRFSNIQAHGLTTLGRTPFIPIVSNLSISLSGIKDLIMDKYEYDGDQAGNKTSDAMGLNSYRESSEFSATYYESRTLSITALHYVWLLYMDAIGKGTMSMTEDHMRDRIYDYMASLYWFVTGYDGMSIVLYGRQTGVFPLNVPISSLIPSERGTPTDPKITINYHCNHSEVLNPSILFDFNHTIDEAAKIPAGSDGSMVEQTVNAAKDVVGKGETQSGYMDNAPSAMSQALSDWRKAHFLVNPANPLDAASIGTQKELHRMAQTSKGVYKKGIYYPAIYNQWEGHPYVWNGKLVYRAISAGLTKELENYSNT